jgi:hypothetical protein
MFQDTGVTGLPLTPTINAYKATLKLLVTGFV